MIIQVMGVLLFPVWILWEPSLAYSLSLLEDFKDTPQCGATGDADDGCDEDVGDEERPYEEQNADNSKYRPALYAPVILGLDDDWMEYSYDEECRHCYYYSFKIHDDIFIYLTEYTA